MKYSLETPNFNAKKATNLQPIEEEVNQVKALESVISVLENLFFSMPIPEEIADKYNYLKEQRFTSVGLPYLAVTKSSYPSIGTRSNIMQNNLQESLSWGKCRDTMEYSELMSQYCLERVNQLSDFLKDPTRPTTSLYDSVDATMSNLRLRLVTDLTSSQSSSRGISPIPLDQSESLTTFCHKMELIQSKFKNACLGIEDTIASMNYQVDQLKNEYHISFENTKLKNANLMGEIDLLRKQLSQIEENSRNEEFKHNRRIEDEVLRLKEDQLREMNRIQEAHDKTIIELNEIHFDNEKRLQSKVHNLIGTDNEIDMLKAKLLREQEALKYIKEKLYSIYEKHIIASQNTWNPENNANYTAEEMKWLDFINYQITKLTNDNKWLVDRLAEFGKENEELKENIQEGNFNKQKNLLQELLHQYQNSQGVLKNYQDAHFSFRNELRNISDKHSKSNVETFRREPILGLQENNLTFEN